MSAVTADVMGSSVVLEEGVAAEGTSSKKLRPRELYRYSWTLFINLGMLGAGVAMAMLGPTLPALPGQLHASMAEVGAMFTFRATGFLFGALLTGRLVDATGNPAVVMLFPLAGTCCGAFVLPLVRSYWLAGYLISFQGLAMGMLAIGGNVLILSLWRDSKYLNGHMHAMHFFWGVGALVSPLFVSAWVARGLDPMSAWMVTGAIVAISVFGFMILSFTSQPKVGADEASATGPVFTKTIIFGGAFLFAYMGSEIGFGGYITTFAMNWLQASELLATNLASLYWGMMCLGRVVAAIVTPYVNHIAYIAAHVLSALVAIIVLLIFTSNPDLEPDSLGSWLGVVLPTAIFGFTLAPLFPGMVLIVEEIQQAPLSGTAASVIMTCAGLGEMVLVVGTGSLIKPFPLSFLWLQLGFCCFLLVAFACNIFGAHSKA